MLSNLLGGGVYLADGFGTVSLSCIRQALVRAPLTVSLRGKCTIVRVLARGRDYIVRQKAEGLGASLASMRTIKILQRLAQ